MVALTGLALVATALGQQPSADLANNSFINMVLPKGVEAGRYLELKTENGTFYTSVPDAKAVSAGPGMRYLPARAAKSPS